MVAVIAQNFSNSQAMVAAIESGALEAEAEPGLTHVVPLAADEAENESMLMY